MALPQASSNSDGAREQRELLNSERIEAQFGSYGIDVLSSDDVLRLSNLYSLEAEGKVTRSFAIVRYPRRVAEAFAGVHQRILGGGSIGASFTQAGWQVIKTHRDFGEFSSTKRLMDMMRIDEQIPLAMHIYILSVEKGAQRYDYARIAEIHHPDYLSLDELKTIYAPDWSPTGTGDAIAQEMRALAQASTR